jgi:hypothetical protein
VLFIPGRSVYPSSSIKIYEDMIGLTANRGDCVVQFKLLCFGIGFQAKATYILSRESKVLLAGAMAAYRPAESEKPCQYFHFPGTQNHSNWQFIL